jgi:hypothetical protein
MLTSLLPDIGKSRCTQVSTPHSINPVIDNLQIGKNWMTAEINDKTKPEGLLWKDERHLYGLTSCQPRLTHLPIHEDGFVLGFFLSFLDLHDTIGVPAAPPRLRTKYLRTLCFCQSVEWTKTLEDWHHAREKSPAASIQGIMVGKKAPVGDAPRGRAFRSKSTETREMRGAQLGHCPPDPFLSGSARIMYRPSDEI